MQGFASWFKVNKDIGVETSLEGEGTSMNQGARFVQDHVTWCHGNIDGLALTINDFQNPVFVNILCDINDARTDQGKTVNVRAQDGTFSVDADSVRKK